MFPQSLRAQAEALLETSRRRGVKLATAESCTGGLLAGLLTEFAGASDVFERGFVTYSNDAKHELLGVPGELIADKGAVSPEVASAMAEGALRHARADISVAVTGVAGPGGGTDLKPVGLVYIAVTSRDGRARSKEFRFGPRTRAEIRLASVAEALSLLEEVLR